MANKGKTTIIAIIRITNMIAIGDTKLKLIKTIIVYL